MIGIYSITNKENNKRYIGKAEIDIKRRWSQHKYQLNKNKHINKHLQNAWNQYGKSAFTFEILEKCTKDVINKREIYWINYFNTTNRLYGYNDTEGGTGGNTVKYKTIEELKSIKNKQRLSSIGKNNILTEDEVKEIKIAMSNFTFDKELSNKYNISISTISKIRTGTNWNWVLPELNEKIKNYRYEMKKIVVNEFFKTGESSEKLSKKLNISKNIIINILSPFREIYEKKLMKECYLLFKNGIMKQDIAKIKNINRNRVAKYIKQYELDHANTEVN